MSARRLNALVRHHARLVAFSLPLVRRLLERPTSAPPDLRVVSDHAWSNTTQSTDLGGTITMDQTAATVANLIRYRLPEYPKVLDVGCAGGTLAGELPPSVHYLGIDASESVIEAARSVWGGDDILFAGATSRVDPVGDAMQFFSDFPFYLAAMRPSPGLPLCKGAFTGGHSRHQHDELREKAERSGARCAKSFDDRRRSLAAKGAVALLPDQREPRAPRLSHRRARIRH